MHKLVIALLLMTLGLWALSAPLCAKATEYEVFVGKILSIDTQNSQIVIQRIATGVKMTLAVPKERVPYLFVGEVVRIWLEPGTNIARHLRRLGR